MPVPLNAGSLSCLRWFRDAIYDLFFLRLTTFGRPAWLNAGVRQQVSVRFAVDGTKPAFDVGVPRSGQASIQSGVTIVRLKPFFAQR
jgi:hypothetical protein